MDLKRKSFVLYISQYQSISQLTMEERGCLLTAMFEYQINGIVSVPLSAVCSMAFSFIKSQFEMDKNKYLNIVERNRANGEKGGRPKKQEKAQKITENPAGFGLEHQGVARDCGTFEQGEKALLKNPKADDVDVDVDVDVNVDVDVDEYDLTTTTTFTHTPSLTRELSEDERSRIEIVFSRLAKNGENVDDFIAYNSARGWRGIGEENILLDDSVLERYVSRWLKHETPNIEAEQHKAEPTKPKFGDFDPNEAFERAIQKTFNQVKSKNASEEEKPLSDRFARFWAVYPKKTGRGTAEMAFYNLNPSEELTDIMIAAVEKQKQWDEWTRDYGQFIPNPATWLNQGRWEDEGIEDAR